MTPATTRSLAGKTLFITGASRGIGLAIAMRAARDGANVVVAAKSITENPRIPGTIYTAAAEIEAAGGQALAIPCDIRFEDQVEAAVGQAVSCFGGIDILVNNASAIDLRGIDALEMKRFDLMHQINARGTYLCCKAALPHLRQSANPHILTLSPPLDLNPKWFSPNLAYTMSKYGMSLVTLGLARDLARRRRRREFAMAGDRDRDGRGGQSSGRRRTAAPVAKARDRRRRRARHSDSSRKELQRQFLHRRKRSGGRRHDRLLDLRRRSQS